MQSIYVVVVIGDYSRLSNFPTLNLIYIYNCNVQLLIYFKLTIF